MSVDGLKSRVRGSRWELPSAYAWGLVRGQWPGPVAQALELRRTRQPVTFAQKVRYKMARDRRPVLVETADKVRVRDFVARRVGPEALVPLLGVAPRAASLPWDRLPREYVAKVNHASGGIVIVCDAADPSARLPGETGRPHWSRHCVHPDSVPPAAVAALLDRWLTLPYRQGPTGRREWAYRGIERRAMLEAFEGGADGLPSEVKVFCIHGEVALAAVLERDLTLALRTVDRFPIEDAEAARERAGLDPATWAWFLDACRALSAGTDMVRVDWLLTPHGPRFGELTNYPVGGEPDVAGQSLDAARAMDTYLTARWQVPETYQ